MEITKAWIRKWEPDKEIIKWIRQQNTQDALELIYRLRNSKIESKYDWLYWIIPKLFKTKRDRARFAVYCMKLVSSMDKECSDDKYFNKAIQVAKNWIENPTRKNENAVIDIWGIMWEAFIAWNGVTWDIAIAWDNGDARIRDKIIDYGIKLLKEK